MAQPQRAGMPSVRLSELHSEAFSHRRTPCTFGRCFARDSVSELLRDSTPKDDRVQHHSRAAQLLDAYAGKPSIELNNQAYGPSQKHAVNYATNCSRSVGELLSSAVTASDNCGSQAPAKRSLKVYYMKPDIGQAFQSKYQVTDKHTGRAEIVATRRPGKATAEVDIVEFDPYNYLPNSMTHIPMKGSIEAAKMGMTGRSERTEEQRRLTTLTPLSHIMRADNLGCIENWVTPNNEAQVECHLGQAKRKFDLYTADYSNLVLE